jgi:hypothetical protein
LHINLGAIDKDFQLIGEIGVNLYSVKAKNKMNDEYLIIKAMLNMAGVNLSEIDKIKE